MKHLIILAISTFLFATFLNQAFANNHDLATEVIAIHDEAMAKMTHMHELKLQLRDTEKTSGPSTETTAAIEALQHAHKEMMNWMHQYKVPKSETEPQSVKEYLLEEKVKIQKVSDDINESINRAEKLL